MSDFDINNLEINGFSVKVVLDNSKENSIIVKFDGIIISEKESYIENYLNSIHEKILDSGIVHVVCDFSGLEMLDRDGFVDLMNWFVKANNVPSDNKYDFDLIYGKKKIWHINLFTLIKNLFPSMVNLKPI